LVKPAQAERQRIETIAEADRKKQVLLATGMAEATRLEGNAQAEVILSKGKAEANAMEVRAQAYQEYNQAAILDHLVAGLPEVVRALSEPLAKVDKITVVSTGGNGAEGTGVDRVTTDMAAMIAQVPAILESLTGVKIGDLLSQVPQIAQATQNKANGQSDASAASLEEIATGASQPDGDSASSPPAS
jgi:flotillin